MARRIRRVIIWVVAVVVPLFVVLALVRSAPRKAASQPGNARAAARFYGAVEPLGGPVYVSAPVTRTVRAVAAREGDTVRAGDLLVRLDDAMEQAQLAAALGQAGAVRNAWAISRDAYERVRGLERGKGVSEQDLRQAQLKSELDSATLAAAEADVKLARAQLEQLSLAAPVPGVVYKLDVRLGQTLAAGDDGRITVGAAGRQARMFVESFWLDRLHVGDPCRVSDPETGRSFGHGRVLSLSPYVGSRSITPNDARERFDAEYRVAIVALDSVADIPIGLVVAAELRAEQ